MAGESSADVCAGYLKALGDPQRLKIVQELLGGPLSVSEIGSRLQLGLANVSHHLRVLYHAHLVETNRSGKFIFYRLNQEFLRTQAKQQCLDFGCCRIDLQEQKP